MTEREGRPGDYTERADQKNSHDQATGTGDSAPNDYVFASDLGAATPEFIRPGHGCLVSIWQLLDELSGKFDDRFPVSPDTYSVSPDTYKVLDLIETLRADRHVDHPGTGWIEFAWNEEGLDQVPDTEFVAMLRDRLSRRRGKKTGKCPPSTRPTPCTSGEASNAELCSKTTKTSPSAEAG